MSARKSTKSGRTSREGFRWCWKCKCELPISSFSKDKTRKSGVQSKCRKCSNLGVDDWRKQHRDFLSVDNNPLPRTSTKLRQNIVKSGRRLTTQEKMEEQRLRQDGLNVRSRKHASTHQVLISTSKKMTQEMLCKEADKWLSKSQN